MKEIKRLLKKLKPVLGKRTNGLWYSYLTADPKKKEQNEDLIKILANRKVKAGYEDRILLPPPAKELLYGEYHLGNVVYPDKPYGKFGLREDEWIKHMLIVGMTGAGKTNTAFQMLTELEKRNKPFLVFDWKKSYRNIIQLPRFKKTLIFTIGSRVSPFYFNPLIPPEGTDAKEWMAKLIDVIKHAYFVGQGVEFFLRKAIDSLYKKFNVYQSSQQFPVFKDIETLLKKEFVKGREMLWMASVKRVLASLSFDGLLGDVVNVRKQGSLAEFLEKDIILELDSLAISDRIFFIEALLLWIYEYRKNQGRREEFKHSILIEEGHHVLSRKKEKTKEESIIETIIRTIREFGESVIVIDQEPSKLSDSVKANTYCKMTFSLGNGKDISDMARCIGLDSEQTSFIDKLNVGEAIVKLSGRCKESFFVHFPGVNVKKGVISDLQIKQHMRNLEAVGIP